MAEPTPPAPTSTRAHDGHTIDVGYVHTLTDDGACREDCPHPSHSTEHRTTVTYEVWRSHPRGRDVRVYSGMSEEQGLQTFAMCEADKAEGYPDAPIGFYLLRATTTYERVTPTGSEGTDD